MAPSAYVVHRIRGRIRLRIRDRRNDDQYFEAVRRQLELVPGIEVARINPVTGTILLLHPGQSDTQVLNTLRQLDLFDFSDGPEPATPALAPLTQGIAMVDQALVDNSGGRVDLRALAYIVLMAVTVLQIRRGQLLGPALPLIGQAMTLLNRVNGWQNAADPDADSQVDEVTVSDDGD